MWSMVYLPTRQEDYLAFTLWVGAGGVEPCVVDRVVASISNHVSYPVIKRLDASRCCVTLRGLKPYSGLSKQVAATLRYSTIGRRDAPVRKAPVNRGSMCITDGSSRCAVVISACKGLH